MLTYNEYKNTLTCQQCYGEWADGQNCGNDGCPVFGIVAEYGYDAYCREVHIEALIAQKAWVVADVEWVEDEDPPF